MTDATSRVEVKTERDVNVVTNEPVVRIFARRIGDRRWSKFVAYAGNNETVEDLEANAQLLGETWLRLDHAR